MASQCRRGSGGIVSEGLSWRQIHPKKLPLRKVLPAPTIICSLTGAARWPAGAAAQSTSAASSPVAYSPAAARAGTEAAVGIVAFVAAGTHSQVLGRADTAEHSVP